MNDVSGTSVELSQPASQPGGAKDPQEGAGEERVLAALERRDWTLAVSLCAREHAGTLGRLCMSMLGTQSDADDVLQETLLAAHQGFEDFDRRSSVRAWLCGIARNKCLKHLEKKRRRGARLRLVPTPDVPAPVDDVVGARRRAREVRELLEQVRPSDRDLLLLRYTAELSFAEVAEICGLAEPTARKRVSRALARLRTLLEDDGIAGEEAEVAQAREGERDD